MEQGIKHVVNWILGPGEDMLNGKQQVGYDIVSAEEYKRNHEAFELQCRVNFTFDDRGLSAIARSSLLRNRLPYMCRSILYNMY